MKPLFQSRGSEDVSNYNPISMICDFSKIYKKIVKSRLINFLEQNELLSKFGFGPGRSTAGDYILLDTQL